MLHEFQNGRRYVKNALNPVFWCATRQVDK